METLILDIGWTNLVVEKYEADELIIFLQDKNDHCITQDIAAIRQAKSNDEPLPRTIECLVWADENTEDYTNSFLIKQYKEEGPVCSQ